MKYISIGLLFIKSKVRLKLYLKIQFDEFWIIMVRDQWPETEIAKLTGIAIVSCVLTNFLNWLCYLWLLTYVDFRFRGMRWLTARQCNEFSHKKYFRSFSFSWWNIFRLVYYLFYRLNFLRDSSNSCLRPALIHSYSPVLESNVPFWIDLSRRVNLGPSSRSLHFSAFLNSYLK